MLSRLLKGLGVLLCTLLFAAAVFWTAAAFTYPELVAIVVFGADKAEDELKDQAKDRVYGQVLQNSVDAISDEQPPARGKRSSMHAIDAARKRQLGVLGVLAVLWAKFADLFYGEFRGQQVERKSVDSSSFQCKRIDPSDQGQPCEDRNNRAADPVEVKAPLK